MTPLEEEILKQEIEVVSAKINHFDGLRDRTKRMAVTLWAAGVGAGLQWGARELVALAAFVPVPFWYFDARYHGYQEGYQRRLRAIREFLRSTEWRRPADAQRYDKEKAPEGFPIPDWYGQASVCRSKHPYAGVDIRERRARSGTW